MSEDPEETQERLQGLAEKFGATEIKKEMETPAPLFSNKSRRDGYDPRENVVQNESGLGGSQEGQD